MQDQAIQLNVTLTRDEYTTLLLMLGMALGAAIRDGAVDRGRDLMASFRALTNKLNAWNPDWTPYRIPVDGARQASITHHGCGMTSFHPKDVSEHYCGNCCRFLEAGEYSIQEQTDGL